MLKLRQLSAGRLGAFKASPKLGEIDRRALTSLVKRIRVYEGKRVEIEFYFTDRFEAKGERGL